MEKSTIKEKLKKINEKVDNHKLSISLTEN